MDPLSRTRCRSQAGSAQDGSQLLAAAKRWARNRRLEYLELQVLAQNEGAQHLYESQDFVEATKVMRCML